MSSVFLAGVSIEDVIFLLLTRASWSKIFGLAPRADQKFNILLNFLSPLRSYRKNIYDLTLNALCVYFF